MTVNIDICPLARVNRATPGHVKGAGVRRSCPCWSPSGQIPGKGQSAVSAHPARPRQSPPEPASGLPTDNGCQQVKEPGSLRGRMAPRCPDTIIHFLLLRPVLLIFPQVNAQQKNTVFGGAQQVGAQALDHVFPWDLVMAADSSGFCWHCPGFSRNGLVPMPHMRSLKPFLIRSIILPKRVKGTKNQP